jgi:L-alanine-DL-glutamate epimerase-like enolase superfamily enzyme
MEKIKRFPLTLIEQPMPAAMKDEALYIKKYSTFPVFADESVIADVDFDYISSAFDGINMKLMKAGSYRNGISILKEARRLKMKTMIGCMVETTLGIGSGLRLESLADYIDLDSYLLLKDEPFHLVKEEEGILSLAK